MIFLLPVILCLSVPSPDTRLLIDQELPRLIQAVKNLARYGHGKLKILAAVRAALREVKEEKVAGAQPTQPVA